MNKKDTGVIISTDDYNEEKWEAMVEALAKPGTEILKELTPKDCHLWHFASALNAEAGELFDAIKKVVIYRKQFDRDNAIEELGDCEFFLEGIRKAIGVTRNQTLKANYHKLVGAKNARYKDGYTDEAAQQRADKNE